MKNTFVSLEGVSRGQGGLNNVSENKKWPFYSKFSSLTFVYLDHQQNQQQRGMLLSKKKKDKNFHTILKAKRSTHILVVTNLHFQIKCYS